MLVLTGKDISTVMTQGSPNTEPRGKTTAKQYVLDRIRRQILSGSLPGGSRLVQADLANDLGVSTTPVREALHDLAAEGLVRFGAHKGAVVHQVNRAELQEVFELRKVLEPMVIRLAIPNMTPDILARLEALCDAMEATQHPPTWVELNREFHGVFMDTSGWPRLAGIVGALHDSACPMVALALRFRDELFAMGNQDHRALLEAARTGDIEEAVVLTEGHMNITRTAIEARVPDPGEERIRFT